MMHLEYKKNSYLGTHIHIQPDHESDVPRLREAVMNNLNIKNPTVSFALKMNAGEFEGLPEKAVAAEAEVANILSELWDDQYSMNVLMLLARAMQEIVDLKLKDSEINKA